MKTRESGMPEEAMWSAFFEPDQILDAMGLDGTVRDVADFGCGYGTFALPAARRIEGVLHGFDIEAEMVALCERRAAQAGLCNARFHHRDFVGRGTGLPDASVDYAMLFNILHAEDPLGLLGEARRILRPGGRVAVIHWRHDAATPRGPSMAIRPRPEDCRDWIAQAGLSVNGPLTDLPPWHYGLVGRRKGTDL